MERFMVVATFKADTSWDEVMAVVPEEQRVVAELHEEGVLGALYLATAARRTVFLEVIASTTDEAAATVRRLPMARWWELDLFALNGPGGEAVAS